MKKKCQNCGHNCHCKGYCLQDYDEEEQTVCCTQCRHEEKEEKIEINEDLFNGAQKMSKIREFYFWNEGGQEEKTEQLSLKRAVKSIQSKFKDKFIGV